MCVTKLLFLGWVLCLAYAKDRPRLISKETNVTVIEGRNAILTCIVENLKNYTVAWLRVDTQTILTIGQHVITKNHRVGVLRVAPRAWSLTLQDVRPSDIGEYMCQINTEPMMTQIYHLNTFDIVDSESSSEVIVQEGGSIASSNPQPIVTWKREDSNLFIVDSEKDAKWKGLWLNLTSAHRDMKRVFLCIVNNGIPPSVSKRILLHVLCKPKAYVIEKMVGVYVGEAATLECHIEAYPPPNVFWTDAKNKMLNNGLKHETKVTSQVYWHKTNFKINNVSKHDVGLYQCHSENCHGAGNDSVLLYTLATTTAFGTSTVDIGAISEPTTTSTARSSSTSTSSLENKPDDFSGLSTGAKHVASMSLVYLGITSFIVFKLCEA